MSIVANIVFQHCLPCLSIPEYSNIYHRDLVNNSLLPSPLLYNHLHISPLVYVCLYSALTCLPLINRCIFISDFTPLLWFVFVIVVVYLLGLWLIVHNIPGLSGFNTLRRTPSWSNLIWCYSYYLRPHSFEFAKPSVKQSPEIVEPGGI